MAQQHQSSSFSDLLEYSRSAYVRKSGRMVTHGIFRYAKSLEGTMRENGVVPTAGATGGFSNIIIKTNGSGISLQGIKV